MTIINTSIAQSSQKLHTYF